MNITSKAFQKTLPSTASVTIGHTTESKRTEAAVPTVGNIAGREAASTVSPGSNPETPRTGPPAVAPETPRTGPPDVAPETPRTGPPPVAAETPRTGPPPVAAETPRTGPPVAPIPNRILPGTDTPSSIATAPSNPPDAPTIDAQLPAPAVVNAGVAAATESTFEIFLQDPDRKDEANKKDAAPAAAAYHPGFVSLRQSIFFPIEVTTN